MVDIRVDDRIKNNLTSEAGADREGVEHDHLAKSRNGLPWRNVCNLSERWQNFRTTWKENHAWPVFYSTVVVNILTLQFGMTLGYAAPAIPDLMTEDETTSINDTSIIFSAMMPFGAMISGPLFGFFLEAFGRHMALMLCVAPCTVGWVLIILSRLISSSAFLPILYIGRFFTGVGIGHANSSVPCYVAELSPGALRGLFVGIFGLCVAVGILLIQLFGIIDGVTYYWLPILPLTTLMVYVLLMAFTTKETPRWLQKTKRTKGTKLVLKWLRGDNYDVEKEQGEIAEQIDQDKNQNILQTFKSKSTLYSLLLGCFLTAFQQLSGITAVIFYSQVIFSAVRGINENADIVSTFCVGAMYVLGNCVLLLFVDKVGRRKLLLVNGMLMCVSSASMGVYYVFNSKPFCNLNEEKNECITALNPVAIVSLMIYSFAYGGAWGGLPNLVSAELLPLHARGAGLGIKAFVSWFSAAVLLLSFEPYQAAVNPWGAFFTFSFIMFCAVLFVYKFIPETKGKTLEEIQKHLFRRNNQIVAINEQDDKPVSLRNNFLFTGGSNSTSHVIIDNIAT